MEVELVEDQQQPPEQQPPEQQASHQNHPFLYQFQEASTLNSNGIARLLNLDYNGAIRDLRSSLSIVNTLAQDPQCDDSFRTWSQVQCFYVDHHQKQLDNDCHNNTNDDAFFMFHRTIGFVATNHGGLELSSSIILWNIALVLHKMAILSTPASTNQVRKLERALMVYEYCKNIAQDVIGINNTNTNTGNGIIIGVLNNKCHILQYLGGPSRYLQVQTTLDVIQPMLDDYVWRTTSHNNEEEEEDQEEQSNFIDLYHSNQVYLNVLTFKQPITASAA